MTGMNWRKSSHSFSNGNCIEVGDAAAVVVGVRDSKLGDASPVLAFTGEAWTRFTAAVRDRGSHLRADGASNVAFGTSPPP